MNIWTIVTPEREFEIEVSKSTLLFNQHFEWKQLTNSINSYFNVRNSNVGVFEDGVPLNKSDWKCFFIPFDASIQLSKITASSPLKEIQYNLTEQLILSPLYDELLEIWEQLDGELDFVNQKFKKWQIQAKLNSIDEKMLSQFINFRSTSGRELKPLEIKELLINIIIENSLEKKTLIIVELPELFATEKELEKFNVLVNDAVNKGFQFMFISNRKSFGVRNFIYKEKIIHTARLEQIKEKICHEVPFYCPKELYDKAKEYLLQLVDNSISEDELLQLSGENFGSIITIIHVMMYNLDMEPIHIPQRLEPNLKKFISELQ